MSRKSENEIKDEIKALYEVKPKLPKRNFFGEDVHAKVDIQIEVLSGDVDEDEFDDKVVNGEWSEDQRDEAQNAYDWMQGDSNESAPSVQWAEIIS